MRTPMMKLAWIAAGLLWMSPASSCDLLRELTPGSHAAGIRQKLKSAMPVREIARCDGTTITTPAGSLCRDTAGVRDAMLTLTFGGERLTGWQLTRRGERMDLLAWAEQRWGTAKNRPPLDTARPWANLHWQSESWQANYVGQGEGKEMMETLSIWETRRNPATARAPACERE